MKTLLVFALLVALLCGPALAGKIDPSLIPDGMYTITIERVIDAAHISAKMENGVEVDLKAAKATVTFSPSMPAKVKIYMVQGEVIYINKI